MTDTPQLYADGDFSEQRYWPEGLQHYHQLRNEGRTQIVLDLEKVESLLYGPQSPSHELMDIMCNVRETEALNGYRGATKFILALLGSLDLVSKGGGT